MAAFSKIFDGMTVLKRSDFLRLISAMSMDEIYCFISSNYSPNQRKKYWGNIFIILFIELLECPAAERKYCVHIILLNSTMGYNHIKAPPLGTMISGA